MSKNRRAIFFSVYLRLWTLSRSLACKAVPFLVDLGADPSSNSLNLRQWDALPAEESTNSIRKEWKAYVTATLPHAKQQISNFMLACIAEGRNHDAEDEVAHRRGDTVCCKLTHSEIENILQSHRGPNADFLDIRSATEADTTPTARRMAATTSLAMQLAE